LVRRNRQIMESVKPILYKKEITELKKKLKEHENKYEYLEKV